MPAPKEGRAAPRGGAQVVVEDRPPDDLCTCCDPRNPLVMRPDFGTLADGSAEFALCVLHDPEPVVYRNRGDGAYLQAPKLALSAAGEIIDSTTGAVIARVAGGGFQRLTTVDDDEPPSGDRPSGPEGGASADRASRPRTVHVDLSQDDFYA
jgi:hypothetical protein